MTLRSKIFLLLALTYAFLVGYLYVVWMPDATRYQVEANQRLQHRALTTLGEGLTPMVLAGQLGDLHDTLDQVRQGNPEWRAVELLDARGRRLYPLAGTPLPAAGADDVQHELVLRIGGNPAATLRVLISQAPLLAEIRAAQSRLIVALAVTTLLALALAAVMLEATVRRPVGRLAAASHALAAGQFDAPLPRAGGDEIGELVRSFADMRDEVRDSQQHLRQLAATLEDRVQQEVARNREKDHLLIQQSRLASMGEMVHNIAHQWRQPLNALGLLIHNIRDDYEYGTMTSANLRQATADAQRLLERMSHTIDDFRDFFRPDREMADFDVGAAVRDALFITEASLKNYNIEVAADIPAGVVAEGYPSQFSQALLNLLINAKEALQQRGPGGRIAVRLAAEAGRANVTVDDTAGGIPEEVLAKIFEPYFTTKEQGSGIGLYMAKMIIEKNMNGSIAASNTPAGARFVVSIPLKAAAAGAQHG
ncbi:MAG: ATP-binding protein [Rhodocyclaceae bacterium]|nr:ATP-binding protein [Rhodocyclaceae bacterium]